MPLRRWLLAMTAALLLAGGCDSGTADPPAEETISREAFIQAYVALRTAALRSEAMEVTPRQRNEILERLGLTQEDLLRFVEVRGDEIDLMREVWVEVDSILRSERGDALEGGRAGGPR